jgi:DIS3-like exonuclease 2
VAGTPAQDKANSRGGSSKAGVAKETSSRSGSGSVKQMIAGAPGVIKEQAVKMRSVPANADRRHQEDVRRGSGEGASRVQTSSSTINSAATHTLQNLPLPGSQLQMDMKHGHVFRGRLRVNAGEPREAYVTVPGLPSDVILRGLESRGNAMEGDEVAVRVLPVHRWYTQHKAAAAAAAGGTSSRTVTRSGEPWLTCKAGPEAVCAEIRKVLEAMPGTRATAQAVTVLTPGPRREQLVGVLKAERCKDNKDVVVCLLPMDPRLPMCQLSATSARSLPEELLEEAAGCTSVESRCVVCTVF